MENTNIIIEKMQQKHIDSIAEIEKECFFMPWSAESLREELLNDTSLFYVIENGNQVMGYIGSNNVLGEIYIDNIAIKNEYRRKGHGEKLLKYLISEGISKKADFITLEVRKSNSNAINLYEKLGFKNVGIRKNFYKNPKEDGIIYTLYLKDR